MSRRQSLSRSVAWNAEDGNVDQRVLRNQLTNPTGERIDKLADTVQILFVVEGTNDIELLRRISLLLHADDESLPNLAEMEQRGELIFVPFGGGHVRAWSNRLAPLQRAEFHLYDHELPPETELRRQAAETVNRRSRCQAVLTNKRCLENYLHPDAILAASGIRVDFDDFDCVAEIAARKLYQQRPGEIPWQLQARRSQSRMANRAKRWLNTTVVEQMTRDMLRESDPNDEIQSWLLAIKDLLAA